MLKSLVGNRQVYLQKKLHYSILLKPSEYYSNEVKKSLKLSNSILEQKKLTFRCRKITDVYLTYKLNDWPPNLLKISRKKLCVSHKLMLNVNQRKFIHHGSIIEFDVSSSFNLKA